MTFKPSRRSVPPPSQPQNRASIAALQQAVNELSGTVGATLQRAVRLGELVMGGIFKLRPDGVAEVDAERIVSLIRTDKDARALAAGFLCSPALLEGFYIASDGTDVTVSEGTAWVPALGYPVRMPVEQTVALPSATNAWVHLYLYVESDGVSEVEAVTTAPASPYFGVARAKTGDTTRRYLGSVRLDGSGNPLPSEMRGELVVYLANVTGAPYRVLTNGTNIAATEVACSSVIPVSARLAHLYFTNAGTAGISFSSGSGISGFSSVVNPTDGVELEMLLSASQSFYYRCEVGSPPANGLYADVWGYTLER